jgi:hypothetical protein
VTSTGSLTRAAAIAAFGLACAAIGAWWNGGDAATPAVAPAIASSTPCLSGEDRLALRRELAEDVRRAVAAAMPAPAAADAAKAAAPDDEVATEAPAPSAGHDTARQIVASAVARGSWRPEDAQEFREVLGGLTHGETVAVLDELSRAINTGRLHVVARDRPTF